MSHITPVDQANNTGAPDTVLLEKIRWSFRQRFRKQVQLLLAEFFDEVDDHLFTTGRSGELCGEGVCLNAMRELRAKQSYFEERFLDSALSTLKKSYHSDVVGFPGMEIDDEAADDRQSENGIEDVEIDLALHAAQRRAAKQHLRVIQRINELQRGVENSQTFLLVEPEVILQAIDVGFGKAQRVVSIPLELRLLFIKLFERHVMLKLERVFQDVISIINHANDPVFVEKLYSSSSAFHRASNNTGIGDEKTVFQSGVEANNRSSNGARRADEIRNSADQLISKLCAERNIPEFLFNVLQKQWREIMFLIGLHRGAGSVEWSEARHAMTLLITASEQKLTLERQDYEQIREQLQRGFSLIQWPRQEQVEFFSNFADHFQIQQTDSHSAGMKGENSYLHRKQLESSISPSGEELLDREDLDEIAKLLGGGGTRSQKQLDDYLADVDALADQTMIEFMLGGSYVQCLLARKPGGGQQYVISKRGARISVTRSRLGVAVALQSGEMRLSSKPEDSGTESRTVLVTANKYRH